MKLMSTNVFCGVNDGTARVRSVLEEAFLSPSVGCSDPRVPAVTFDILGRPLAVQ